MEIKQSEPVFLYESLKNVEKTRTPMRRTVHEQLSLVVSVVNHKHAEELRAISERLDRMSGVLTLVRADLVRRGTSTKIGREGMSAERALRCAIAKQMNGWSYEELAFHLGDSLNYRAFCRFGIGDPAPKKSTLKRNIKRLAGLPRRGLAATGSRGALRIWVRCVNTRRPRARSRLHAQSRRGIYFVETCTRESRDGGTAWRCGFRAPSLVRRK